MRSFASSRFALKRVNTSVLTYPPSSFDRDRLIAAIKSVGMLEVKREARIAMRTINAVWKDQVVADEDLKRMADAAERIVRRKQKRNDERVAAIAWIKAERDEIGLTALAKLLGVDAANFGKMIEGKRNLPSSLMQKIRLGLVSNEAKRRREDNKRGR
jgi:DNA-binding transcriptional regulator PaaX